MTKEKKELKSKEDSNIVDKNVDNEEMNNSCHCENEMCNSNTEKEASDIEKITAQMESLKNQLEEKSKKCDEYFGMLQRVSAEFDNFKKRTAREKESIYIDAISDVVKSFLPMLDSVDKALEVCRNDNGKASTNESLIEGIELIGKQIDNVLKGLEIEKINSINEEFDPELHNAVMHVDDEAFGQNIVIEEFQRGYKYKDKVIRYSMVKVAN